MADRFVWVPDVLDGQGDVSGRMNNVFAGQQDLSDRIGVPFVGTADVNGRYMARTASASGLVCRG